MLSQIFYINFFLMTSLFRFKVIKNYENINDELKYYFAKCGILCLKIHRRIWIKNLCGNAGSAPDPYIRNTDRQP